MKALLPSTLIALAGFALGLAFGLRDRFGEDFSPLPERTRPVPTTAWSAAGFGPANVMQGLAEHAATLSPDQWPGFFESQLDRPANSRLTAKLWAEADPAGFWEWLKQSQDRLQIERFADDLLITWATAQPDAAMTAACQVTDKALGGQLRRRVIDTAWEADLEKGLALAARAGDFNQFGWGTRKWMEDDPAAAVKGLAALPAVSDYRRFLDHALPTWAHLDPLAALDWMKSHSAVLKEGASEECLTDGFRTAATAEPEAAWEAAHAISDPHQRDLALAGVVAAGQLDPDSARSILAELPLPAKSRLASDLVQSRKHRAAVDIALTFELLQQLPSNDDKLRAISSLASTWHVVDSEKGWQWAASLPDPALRRRALVGLTFSQDPEDLVALISALPPRDLSPELIKSAHNRIPADQRDSWTRRLPADRAAWAESVAR